MIKKFIPSIIENTIYDIDFKAIYDSGKRFILCDLDNTLIPYDMSLADEVLKAKLADIQNIGLNIIIVSNNHKARVRSFSNDLGLVSFYSALKPLSSGLKKALKYIKNTYYKTEKIKDIKKYVITLGDQLMTDVFASSRLKLDSILVRPIKKKSEKWYTRFNRRMEKMVLKRMSKKYPKVYEEINEKHEY